MTIYAKLHLYPSFFFFFFFDFEYPSFTFEASPKALQLEKPKFRPRSESVTTKPNQQALVKGKKVIAQNKAALSFSLDAAKGAKSNLHSLPLTSHELKFHEGKSNPRKDEEQHLRVTSEFQFTTMPRPKMGYQFKRGL